MAEKDDILDLANERFKVAEVAGRENRKEAKNDLKFLKGDPVSYTHLTLPTIYSV